MGDPFPIECSYNRDPLYNNFLGLSSLEKRDSCYQTIVEYLERSHSPGRAVERDRDTHETILSRALSAPEELLHHAMYSHLIETGQEERLVKINTAYLEVYLRAAADTATPGDISHLNLLWRHVQYTLVSRTRE